MREELRIQKKAAYFGFHLLKDDFPTKGGDLHDERCFVM